jgi:predicted small secreted protein
VELEFMRKIVVLAAAAAALLVSACNTIEGAGRDVASAGKAVSGAARDAKN